MVGCASDLAGLVTRVVTAVCCMVAVVCVYLCDSAVGYYEQFGKCVVCPPSHGASVGAFVGLSFTLIVLCTGVFFVRHLLPIDVLKLGLSMLQVPQTEQQ